jgi:glycosyltransferase involved in cell wall biosynthesis
MGVPQNLENVIEGFIKADLQEAELWLVGDGVMANPLKEKYGDAANVRFCGRQPRNDMPKWFAQAEVLIISLTDRYSLTLPGKSQSYIKTGKPLLGILNGEARELIEEYEIGYVASPSKLEEIFSAFRRMRDMCESGQSTDFGERAKRLSKSMFDRDKLISQLWKSN